MMSSSTSSQVQSELQTLKKDMNEFLTTELHYILQPDYRNKNKARKLLDTLLKLVGPVEHVLEDPTFVHDTSLDDAMKLQIAVVQQLEKDFPNPDDHTALQQSAQYLKAISALIKQLRRDVPTQTH